MVLQLVLNHPPSSEEVTRGSQGHHLHVWCEADLTAKGVCQNGSCGATTPVSDGWSRELSCGERVVGGRVKIVCVCVS